MMEAGGKISRWERGLLDLTLKNSLLNVRAGRTAVLLSDRTSDEIADAVRNGKVLFFDDAASICCVPEDADPARTVAHISSAARTYAAETGADPLYLGIGAMVWSTGKGKECVAPLVLWGAELTARKPSHCFSLGSREEPPGINHTLLELLRRDYGVDIKMEELATGGAFDFDKVLHVFREVVKSFPGWRVEERTVLGLFSYHRYIIWNDLHGNWEAVRRNALVGSLDKGRLHESVSRGARGGGFLPLLPLSADSTQMEAISAAVEGRSFVLHGPPGTGKSQTIANMIAGCLAEGKKVLFVSEKQAALDVVAGMLERIGIGRFCLGLHSGKTRKTSVVRYLREALSDERPSETGSDVDGAYKKLKASRDEFNDINDSLHRKRRFDLSARDCISAFCGMEYGVPYRRFNLDAFSGFEAKEPGGTLSMVRELQAICTDAGSPAGSPFRSLAPESRESLLELRSGMDALFESLRRLDVLKRSALGVLFDGNTERMDYENLTLLRDLCRLLLQAGDFPDEGLRGTDSDILGRARTAVTLRDERDVLCRDILELFYEGILTVDPRTLSYALTESRGKWFGRRIAASFRVGHSLRPHMKKKRWMSGKGLESTLDKLSGIADLNFRAEGLESDEKVRLWSTDESVSAEEKLARIDRASEILGLFRKISISGSGPSIESVGNFLVGNASVLGNYAGCFDKVQEALASIAPRMLVSPELGYDGDWCAHMLSLRDGWSHRYRRLRQWNRYLELKKEMEERGLTEFVSDIDCGVTEPEKICDSFMKSYYFTLAAAAIEEDSNLHCFDSANEESSGDWLRKMDGRWHSACRRALRSKMSSLMPDLSRDATSDPETVLFLRCLRNGCRGITIREFLERTWNIIRKVCPCFMMSPSSVSQFLQPGHGQFDVVIIDEASQMPTCEALGAISRGGSTVIVGDPKQLPPTSFFIASQFDDGDEASVEQESILDDCLAISMESRYLGWHYRSSHESLIAFSNALFYNNALKTFPTPDEKASKIRFNYVGGRYGRGTSRCNEEEADRVVADVRERLVRGDTSTLGIVTFNSNQQRLIEDKFTDLLAGDAALQSAAGGLSQPIFVKNLETVQGDERDVILFSVGYGPDHRGRIANTFGPLTREGGWRRLNVAVSRSREEMVVYSSINPEDIVCADGTGEGVRALKAFLLYARDGVAALPQAETPAERTCRDGLALEIAAELESRGWKTVTRVGRSANSIDVGVCSPDDPDQFILGILCDSDSDHRSWSDRETVSIPILKRRGWKLVRVWPPEWWEDRNGVIERICEELSRMAG